MGALRRPHSLLVQGMTRVILTFCRRVVVMYQGPRCIPLRQTTTGISVLTRTMQKRLIRSSRMSVPKWAQPAAASRIFSNEQELTHFVNLQERQCHIFPAWCHISEAFLEHNGTETSHHSHHAFPEDWEYTGAEQLSVELLFQAMTVITLTQTPNFCTQRRPVPPAPAF